MQDENEHLDAGLKRREREWPHSTCRPIEVARDSIIRPFPLSLSNELTTTSTSGFKSGPGPRVYSGMNEFTFGYRPERRYKAYIVEVIDHTLEALQLQSVPLQF